jgi:hypothetical protein
MHIQTDRAHKAIIISGTFFTWKLAIIISKECVSHSRCARALLSQKPTKGFCEADSQHMRSLGNKMDIYAAHGGFIRDSRALAAREDDNNP